MKWIGKVVAGMKRRGTEGAFTAQAHRAGMSPTAYASKVTRPGSHASTKTKERAQFVKNVRH